MELGVASVTVGDNCDGCGLCVLGCPLGAIDMVGRSVVSTCRSCTGCGLCREVCPAGAITLVPTTIARNAGPTGDAARSGAPLMAQERREPAGSLVSAEHLANRAADADRQMRSEVANRLLRNAGQHP
ncbi:MAG: 4Fe-4S dicluster domain-containing protein [Aeromicrobium sp.]